MKFIKQKIEGVYLIKPILHEDERGVFRRSFCGDELSSIGIKFTVKQGNISENFKKHTLRGFHYQVYPNCESKIITCVTGSLFNVIIDLRKESETYLNWVSSEISAKNKESIYMPAGCTNAFLTMSENTIIHYYMSDSFNPNGYKGIRFNDPKFNVEWPCEPKVISDKDLNIPDFIGD